MTERRSGPEQPFGLMMPAPSGGVQLRSNGYGFARALVTVPLGIDEFGEAMRSFPILFAEEDSFPFGLLTLRRENGFVDGGRWDGYAYLPRYLRRYPFVIGETDAAVPDILLDHNPEAVIADGEGGELLFENGEPTPLAQSMFEECRNFLEGGYRETCIFAEALRSSGILAPPDEGLGLPIARTPFEVVDRQKLDRRGAAFTNRWAATGWLTLIDQHLGSLERFTDLLARDAKRGTRS